MIMDHLKSSGIKFIYLGVYKKMALRIGFQVELRQEPDHLARAFIVHVLYGISFELWRRALDTSKDIAREHAYVVCNKLQIKN